jgi:D-alanine-D-alanine ligase
VPRALERRLGALALRAFRLLACRDYARVDFRVTPEGQPYILEVNPNPDVSAEADLTRCLRATSLSHATFLARLVRQALKRRE